MSSELAGLVIGGAVGTLLFVIAMLIRLRGPVGLVKNVDWNRVSDPHALGYFVSLIFSALSALIIGHGAALYAFRFQSALRNTVSVVFVVLVCMLVLAMMLGQLRYQDKPKRDGR
jgi:hypothetical protein